MYGLFENQEMADESNYRETDQSVRGLQTRAQAESLRELTERGLRERRQDEDYCLRISERPDGLFDLLVLKRVN